MSPGPRARGTGGPDRPCPPAAGPSRRAVLLGGLAALAARPRPAGAAPAPRPVADFLDSVGVNLHLGSEPYASRFETVRDLLAEAGIRHVRDELRPSNDLGRWARLHAAHGVRAQLLVSPVTNTVPEMLAYLEALGPGRVSAIEGQNEGDSPWFTAQPAARPDWSSAVVAYQRAVYRALRTRYDARTLPVVSPTVLDYRPQDVAPIRGAAPFCDVVAIHSYVQGGQEPETADDYAALSWYLAHMAEGFKPGAPVMSTEVGYCTPPNPGRGGVSEAAAAIYVPRLLLHNFAAGLRRSFLYELMDGGTDPRETEHHWGLVHHDGRPKPAYRALRGLMRALSAPDAPRDEAPREVALPEAGADLRAVPLGRRDGGTVVALWRALRCWDPAARADLAPEARPQRVVPSRPAARARAMVPNDEEAWTEVAIRDGAASLPVGAKVVLLWLS